MKTITKQVEDQVYRLYQDGYTIEQIKENMSIGKTSIRNIIEKYLAVDEYDEMIRDSITELAKKNADIQKELNDCRSYCFWAIFTVVAVCILISIF